MRTTETKRAEGARPVFLKTVCPDRPISPQAEIFSCGITTTDTEPDRNTL